MASGTEPGLVRSRTSFPDSAAPRAGPPAALLPADHVVSFGKRRPPPPPTPCAPTAAAGGTDPRPLPADSKHPGRLMALWRSIAQTNAARAATNDAGSAEGAQGQDVGQADLLPTGGVRCGSRIVRDGRIFTPAALAAEREALIARGLARYAAGVTTLFDDDDSGRDDQHNGGDVTARVADDDNGSCGDNRQCDAGVGTGPGSPRCIGDGPTSTAVCAVDHNTDAAEMEASNLIVNPEGTSGTTARKCAGGEALAVGEEVAMRKCASEEALPARGDNDYSGDDTPSPLWPAPPPSPPIPALGQAPPAPRITCTRDVTSNASSTQAARARLLRQRWLNPKAATPVPARPPPSASAEAAAVAAGCLAPDATQSTALHGRVYVKPSSAQAAGRRTCFLPPHGSSQERLAMRHLFDTISISQHLSPSPAVAVVAARAATAAGVVDTACHAREVEAAPPSGLARLLLFEDDDAAADDGGGSTVAPVASGMVVPGTGSSADGSCGGATRSDVATAIRLPPDTAANNSTHEGAVTELKLPAAPTHILAKAPADGLVTGGSPDATELVGRPAALDTREDEAEHADTPFVPHASLQRPAVALLPQCSPHLPPQSSFSAPTVRPPLALSPLPPVFNAASARNAVPVVTQLARPLALSTSVRHDAGRTVASPAGGHRAAVSAGSIRALPTLPDEDEGDDAGVDVDAGDDEDNYILEIAPTYSAVPHTLASNYRSREDTAIVRPLAPLSRDSGIGEDRESREGAGTRHLVEEAPAPWAVSNVARVTRECAAAENRAEDCAEAGSGNIAAGKGKQHRRTQLHRDGGQSSFGGRTGSLGTLGGEPSWPPNPPSVREGVPPSGRSNAADASAISGAGSRLDAGSADAPTVANESSSNGHHGKEGAGDDKHAPDDGDRTDADRRRADNRVASSPTSSFSNCAELEASSADEVVVIPRPHPHIRCVAATNLGSASRNTNSRAGLRRAGRPKRQRAGGSAQPLLPPPPPPTTRTPARHPPAAFHALPSARPTPIPLPSVLAGPRKRPRVEREQHATIGRKYR